MFHLPLYDEVNEILFLTLAYIIKEKVMALKGQKTTSDYIEWDKLQSLILKLERDNEIKFALLIATGMYTALRISDILQLRWSDLIDKDIIELTEKKTKKFRRIKINQHLNDIILRNYQNQDREELVFINRFGTSAISVQYVNRKLKVIAEKYNITKDVQKFKSHSFRKSMGRYFVEKNNYSSKSLLLLSELMNHQSVSTTKIYLGIRESEILDVYDSL